MNTPQHSSAPSATSTRLMSIKWLAPLVVLPLVGFAIYVGWLLYGEYQAHGEMNAKMTPIRAEGPSPEDAWLAEHFAAMTSSEGTAAWSKIIMLSGSVGWNAIGELPIIGSGPTLRTLEVGAQWEDQRLVDEYLAAAQPLIDLIYEAEEYPTPVWQPMDFRGFQTMLPELQESRQIARILQLDFEHAIISNDRVRAMRDLQALQYTAEAFDWDLFLIGELVNVALRSMRYMAIQRSLYADVWSSEDLELLIDQTQQPLPLAQSWQRSMRTEKAVAVAYMQGPLYSPSNRLRLLQRYTEMEALASSEPGNFAPQAVALERQWQVLRGVEDSLFRMLQPAIAGYARAFDRLEHSRRLVLTSLAVKVFQLTHERWPNDLQELTQVGLRSQDWTIPGAGPLGYAIQDDEQMACVWGVDDTLLQSPEGNPKISAECPDYAGAELEKMNYYLTLIK